MHRHWCGSCWLRRPPRHRRRSVDQKLSQHGSTSPDEWLARPAAPLCQQSSGVVRPGGLPSCGGFAATSPTEVKRVAMLIASRATRAWCSLRAKRATRPRHVGVPRVGPLPGRRPTSAAGRSRCRRAGPMPQRRGERRRGQGARAAALRPIRPLPRVAA